MFFSTEMLSKRGPLAKVWLAAHVERKVSKTQTLQTSIPTTVTVILEPASTTISTPPLALRLSGQLLLGIARIYSKQAKYLLEDCSEASDQIRAAFRSGAVEALTDVAAGDDHLLLPNMPNAQSRDAINLRSTANRNLFEFELRYGDGFGYGFGDNWEDLLEQQAAENEIVPATGTGRSRIDAEQAEITLAEHQSMIHLGGRSELGLEDLGQQEPGLMGDGEEIELGLVAEEEEAPVEAPFAGDDTLEMEVGRDAPGTADRRSARESLLPGDLGDMSVDKSYETPSRAGDISFEIEGGEPAFEPTGRGAAFDDGDQQPMDLGLGEEQGAQDVAMADPEAQPAEGQTTPRATTPVPNPLLQESIDVTPRTSHRLAPHLQSPGDGAAGTAQQPPKKKTKHQLVDRVTELDSADHLPSSQRTGVSQLSTTSQLQLLPKDRYQLQHYRLSLDPSRHEFLPKPYGQHWLMAAPAGLCKELQELFQFPAKAGMSMEHPARDRGTKRTRGETEEQEELQSEHGRRGPDMPTGEDDISRIDVGDDTLDMGAAAGDESGAMFGAEEEFLFELPEEQDVGPEFAPMEEGQEVVDIPGVGAEAPATPAMAPHQPHAEGEPSKLDIFDEPGESQSQVTDSAELERNDVGKTKWSKNTVKALKVLKDELKTGDDDDRSRVMKFTDVSERATRKAAAGFFFELLVLGTRDCLKLKQTQAFGQIEVLAKDRLWEVLDQEQL